MALHDKDLGDLIAEDITDLLGVSESLHLEFKVSVSWNDSGKAELLKDVVALANAEGGHLIIGVEEDDQNRAAAIVPINDAASVCERIRDLCADRIERRIAGLQARAVNAGAGQVVVVRVPNEEPKPHWIRMPKGAVRIPKRFGDGTRAMTLDEVRESVLSNRVLRTLEEVAARLKVIDVRSAGPADKPGEMPASRLLREADPSRLRPELDAQFQSVIGDAPSYRLTITPSPVPTDLPLYGAFDQLFALVQDPPQVRDHGWDLRPTDQPVVEESGLVAFSRLTDGGLRILFNGFAEFWASTTTDSFQWAYADMKRPRPFFLDSNAIIEPIVCLMKLGVTLSDLMTGVQQFEVTAEFWNCRGAKLIKFPPGTHGHRMALGFSDKPLLSGYIGELAVDRISIPPRRLSRDELGDEAAQAVARDVYQLFGHVDVEFDRFFDEDGSFKLK